MLNNLSKETPIPFIGTIVEFDDQKEQVTGQGWGWRYKVAIMNDYSSSKVDIDNSKIDYALAMLPSTAGSGGANRGQSVRIAQGDVVYGHKIGGKRGISIILGIFGRTESIKYGGGRFDAKSGFYGKMQPKNLQGREEKGESSGNNVSRPLNTGSGSDKTQKKESPSENQIQQVEDIAKKEKSGTGQSITGGRSISRAEIGRYIDAGYSQEQIATIQEAVGDTPYPDQNDPDFKKTVSSTDEVNSST